jgi:hypothetical protein
MVLMSAFTIFMFLGSFWIMNGVRCMIVTWMSQYGKC